MTDEFRSMDVYQVHATRTQNRSLDCSTQLATLGLGIAGEAGEVADLIKKHLGHGHDLDWDKLREELGDVLWYVACLADRLGFKLAEVAAANVEKLKRRYPDELEDASLDRALEDVRAERGRQDARWGEQSHPDGTSLSLEHTAAREAARQECDLAAAAGVVTWRHILNEEVREAFAETSVEALRRELVQVAAVAVAWIEDLDRRVKP